MKLRKKPPGLTSADDDTRPGRPSNAAKAIAKAGYEPVWKDFDQSLLADPTVSEPMESPEYQIGKIESAGSLDPLSIK